jgi:hypothetical protein
MTLSSLQCFENWKFLMSSYFYDFLFFLICKELPIIALLQGAWFFMSEFLILLILIIANNRVVYNNIIKKTL